MTVLGERERHAPGGEMPGQPPRCAFCGFAWSGHPFEIQVSPDALFP